MESICKYEPSSNRILWKCPPRNPMISGFGSNLAPTCTRLCHRGAHTEQRLGHGVARKCPQDLIVAPGSLIQLSSLKEIRRQSGHLAQFVGILWHNEFGIIAIPDSHQFIGHECLLAALDLNTPQWSCHDVCFDCRQYTIADANSSSEGLVDAFKPRGD